MVPTALTPFGYHIRSHDSWVWMDFCYQHCHALHPRYRFVGKLPMNLSRVSMCVLCTLGPNSLWNRQTHVANPSLSPQGCMVVTMRLQTCYNLVNRRVKQTVLLIMASQNTTYTETSVEDIPERAICRQQTPWYFSATHNN